MATLPWDSQCASRARSDDDLDLMRRAQAGDAEAFSRLYSSHLPAVTAFLRKRGGVTSSLEVMAQEVFLRAWQNRQRFKGRAGVKTYLLAIARHVWLQAAATEGRESRIAEVSQRWWSSTCPYCADPCPLAEPEAAACREERQAALLRRIGGLPRLPREAFLAVFVGGLDLRAAADVAGCSHEVYAKRVRRAISLLRAGLRGDD